MSLNYSFTGEWNGATKDSVGKWVKQKLTVVQDGEAPEDLFLEYIIVMIGNGKRMQELSHELQDFIGEKKANDFADDLGQFLQNVPSHEPADPVVEVPVQNKPTAAPKACKDVLDGGLQSSRSAVSSNQKSSRLLDSALRSTNTTPSNKRAQPESNKQLPATASKTDPSSQVPQVTAAGAATGGGLFTKRGHIKQNTVPANQKVAGEASNKKRKVILGDQGFRIQPTFASNQMNSSNQIMNQYDFPGSMAGGIERERMMHMGDFRPPPPIMMNESSGFHPMHIDPAHAYIERMHAMAHMNGFNSMEDMMMFQQNMMTNMMAGAPMEMQMRGPGGLVAHARGQFPPYQAGDPSQFQRRPGGPSGYRHIQGKFKASGAETSKSDAVGAKISPPAPPPIVPVVPTPLTAKETPISVQSKLSTPLAPATVSVDASREQSETTFGYSGGGGPGGFRGRGRGRGDTRGGFNGSIPMAGRGRETVDYESYRDVFPNAVRGRGRGSFRGRGYVASVGLSDGVHAAGPPASFNKVWVREADLENPLVAGR